MDVNDVFEIIKYCSNATINGDISVAEFNRIAPLGENSYINFLLGAPQQYQYQRPQPRIQYSLNRNIRQKLTPLISEPEVLDIDNTGKAYYPSGYLLLDAMYQMDLSEVRYASQEKLSSFIRSKIDPVSANPIYLIEDQGFQFYPITLGQAKISFVKLPSLMVLATTPDSNGRPVYDENNSTNPIWSDTDLFEVILRILQVVGVNLQLPILYQYADQIKKEG